jgi:hypothetical protein
MTRIFPAILAVSLLTATLNPMAPTALAASQSTIHHFPSTSADLTFTLPADTDSWVDVPGSARRVTLRRGTYVLVWTFAAVSLCRTPDDCLTNVEFPYDRAPVLLRARMSGGEAVKPVERALGLEPETAGDEGTAWRTGVFVFEVQKAGTYQIKLQVRHDASAPEFVDPAGAEWPYRIVNGNWHVVR